MNLRKSNFILQIIFYLLFNTYSLQSIKATESINNEITPNNVDKIEENLQSTNLQEDIYLLGAGDSIIFSVIGVEELRTETKILNDGNAIIPLLGPIKLKGLTVSSASRYLETLLTKELINPKVELFIIENRPIKVSIIGEISRPGIYKLNSLTNDLPTVITAIEEAGGISKFADLTKITLQRQLPGLERSYKKTNLNLRNLVFKGDQSQNPFLFDGDIIEVKKVKNLDNDFLSLTSTSLSPSTITVNFLGEVENPGTLDLDANTTLVDGILAAGGPRNWRSNYGNVEILRINRNGSAFRRKYRIDLSQGYSEKNNPVLNNGDSVWIRRNNFAKASDALSSISAPFRDLVSVWTIFKLVE